MTVKEFIELVAMTDKDLPFLRKVYGSTREDELSLVDWSKEQCESFLDMQFQAQHLYYGQQFSEAEFCIIKFKGEPVGRLYVDYRDDEIRIVDIALLSQHRNRGIGTELMQDLMARASRGGKCIGIHVEKNNPALNWYRELGFEEQSDQGVYLFMKWTPQGV